MIRCPKCKTAHKGRRTLEQLIAEGSRVVALALDCHPERALQYLRTQWLGGALEIAGYCADCVVATIALGCVEVEIVASGEAVRQAEELLGAVDQPSNVVQFRRPPKDAAHLGTTFDSTRQP